MIDAGIRDGTGAKEKLATVAYAARRGKKGE
jgi:hypothetical protein